MCLQWVSTVVSESELTKDARLERRSMRNFNTINCELKESCSGDYALLAIKPEFYLHKGDPGFGSDFFRANILRTFLHHVPNHNGF